MPVRPFQIFYRKLRHSRMTWLINIVGLSAGLACSLLIYIWIYDELHVDRGFADADRLYSVMRNDREGGHIVTEDDGSIILGKALRSAFPEVEYAVATTPADWFRTFSLSTANSDAVKGAGNFAGKDFFHVFPRDIVAGDASAALTGFNTIAISRSLAARLFHGVDGAVGKTVKWTWNAITRDAVVAAVYADFPASSTVRFDLVLPIAVWEEIIHASEASADLSGGPFNTFIVVKRGADAATLNTKITHFIQSAIPASTTTLFITKYADRYLQGHYVNGVQEGGRIDYVRLFAIIALAVLLIAGINFVNLSTARASERMKEVGIKKTLGASRPALIRQFLAESVVLAVVAQGVAVLIVLLLLPAFKALTGKTFTHYSDPWLIFSVLGFTLLTGLLAGVYPALYLSRFSPVTVLKGKWVSPAAGLNARKVLVVFQFAASLIFIVVVMVVYSQVKFAQTIDPGYDKDNVIYFDMQGQVEKDPEAFAAGLKTIPGVVAASSMENTIVLPPAPVGRGGGVEWTGNDGRYLNWQGMYVDYGAIETLGIKMSAGRTFSRAFADSQSVILNEAAIRAMQITNPIGKTIRMYGQQKTIIGVTHDFHFNSLREPVFPFLFTLDPKSCLIMIVRVKKDREKEILQSIARRYKQLNPGIYFDYKFLDDDYQRQYAADNLVATLCKYFAGLTILISCLGLFGLTAFAVDQRVKEIGIRRVLGSGKAAIAALLSADFAKAVGVSVALGLPLSYWIANRWLDQFAYRIVLEPSYFLVSAFLTVVVAGLTIGIQSIRASAANPVESLKHL